MSCLPLILSLFLFLLLVILCCLIHLSPLLCSHCLLPLLTVTWSNSNPLASVFLLTDSVSTSTVTQAPLSSSLAGPTPLVEAQTPTRDEPQEVNTPAVHGTPLSVHAPSPAAPATLFLRSPSIISTPVSYTHLTLPTNREV